MMKISIQILAVIVLFAFACNTNQQEKHNHDGNDAHAHPPGTHQHEDGSIHSDHHHDQHIQEEFKVNQDSVSSKDSLHNQGPHGEHTH